MSPFAWWQVPLLVGVLLYVWQLWLTYVRGGKWQRRHLSLLAERRRRIPEDFWWTIARDNWDELSVPLGAGERMIGGKVYYSSAWIGRPLYVVDEED